MTLYYHGFKHLDFFKALYLLHKNYNIKPHNSIDH